MIGNTVLEPPILMVEALLPAPWARDWAWASGDVARTALQTAAIGAAIGIERTGRFGRMGEAMAINSRSGKEPEWQSAMYYLLFEPLQTLLQVMHHLKAEHGQLLHGKQKFFAVHLQ
jgi:hypothetical protein